MKAPRLARFPRPTRLIFAVLIVTAAAGSAIMSDVIVRGEGPAVIEVGDGDDGPVVRIVGDDSGYLGVNIEEEIDQPEGGARVTRVVDGSPAADAGIREGDVIVGFDGEVVRGPAALTRRIHQRKPGDKVGITLLREGVEVDVEAELGQRSDLWLPQRLGNGAWVLPDVGETLGDLNIDLGELDLQLGDLQLDLGDLGRRLGGQLAPLAQCDGQDCFYVYGLGGRPKLGVELVEATPELRRHLGGDDDRGLLVSKVLAGTPAESADIRVGDLILAVGGDPIARVADLRSALASRVGESFDIDLVRDGRPLSVNVTLPGDDEEKATGPRARFRVAPRIAVPRPPSVPLPPTPPVAPAAPPSPRPFVRSIV